MMKDKHYTDQTLAYLRTHKGLTAMQALNQHGNMRLSQTILLLRKRLKIQGDKERIITYEKLVKDRNGLKKYVADYRLEKVSK